MIIFDIKNSTIDIGGSKISVDTYSTACTVINGKDKVMIIKLSDGRTMIKVFNGRKNESIVLK